MKEIKIDDALKNPDSLMRTLAYSAYAHNRDLGMSAEKLKKLFPLTGDEMERQYVEADILFKNRNN